MRPECAARGFAVRRCVPKLRAMPHPTLPACVLEHRSTADLEPALRHAAWQEIAHRWVDFRPAPEVPLEAELTTLSSGVCTLGATRSSAYEMRTGARRAQPDDMVVLTLMQSGNLLPQAYPRKWPGALMPRASASCSARASGSRPPNGTNGRTRAPTTNGVER